MTTTTKDEPLTPEFDITRPHPARMYDYLLGGYFL